MGSNGNMTFHNIQLSHWIKNLLIRNVLPETIGEQETAALLIKTLNTRLGWLMESKSRMKTLIDNNSNEQVVNRYASDIVGCVDQIEEMETMKKQLMNTFFPDGLDEDSELIISETIKL